MHAQQYVQKSRDISIADEHALALRIKQGDKQALDDLVSATLSKAATIARRYQDMGIPLEDLVAVSSVALIRAAHRYDPVHDGRFLHHASWWIRQEIMAEFARAGRPVTLPPKVYKRGRKLLRRIDRLEQNKGRSVGLDEAAEELQISPEQLDDLAGVIQDDVSLDEPAEGTEEPGITMLDMLVYEDDPQPYDVTVANMAREKIEYAVSSLPPRERDLIRLTFGLGEKVYTIEEASLQLGLSENKARQLRKRALRRLQEMPVMRFFA